MGQCASRKSVGAYSSTNCPERRPMAATDMNHHFKRHYFDNNQNQDDNKEHTRRSFTRGVRTSFGFKRPATAIPVQRDTSTNGRPVDNNGNDDLDSPDSTDHVSGRTTPRLAPPKKEANATRLNRFGFRNNSANVNRSRPATASGIPTENKNNNVEKIEKPKKSVSIAPSVPRSKLTNNKTTVNNKIKTSKVTSPSQATAPAKYTFHSTQLPKPQLPVRVSETKTAKTAANINRKVSSASQRSDEAAFSSKEGSVTEDSGVGSHTSGNNSNFTGDSDTLHGVELMDSSPTFGARRKPSRTRNLELVVSGTNFDIRDLDDSTEDGVVTEVAVIPLPRLPSVFGNNSDARSTNVFGNVSTGMVRERTLEFERQIDKNRRKISVTSSEGFSEDYGEEEKSFRDRSSNEKAGQAVNRLYSSSKSYRESHSRKSKHSDKDSSPTSSDDQDWELGGEGLAEVCSISFSSSDESKDKEISPLLLRPTFIKSNNHSEQMSSSCTGAIPKDSSRSVLHSRDELDRTGESLRHSYTKPSIPSESSYHLSNSCSGLPKDGPRSVLLTIEEPKYTSLSQICPPRTLSCTMMTSSSSMSSSTSSATKEYFKTSLFLLDEDRKPNEFASSLTSTLTNNSNTSTPKDNLKSVLLSIEDPKFAAVAASTSGNLLDDETSPVDSLISSYTESEEIISKNKAKTSKSSTDSKDVNEKSPLSPESPGTPTNASLSLSEGRDFLIDDEIADQPALMFNDTMTTMSVVDRIRNEFSDERMNSEHQNISDSVATLVDSTPKLSRKILRSCEGSPALARAKNPLLSRTASVDTLSPCESIASDDLMMDFDASQSSGIEDSTDRLHLNDNGGLHSLDEATLRSELENQDSIVARQWSSLLGTQSNKDSPPYSVVRTNNFLRSRTTTPSSVPDSPRSGLRNNHSSASPLLRSARTTHGSPAAYDSDDSLRLDRVSHGSMVNDIVGIKTMLLKLKRVLQESEPLNPFEPQPLKNGLYNGLSNEQSDLESVDSLELTSSPALEMGELRRQIEFLQSQLDDRDRTVHQLQNQISKYNLDKHQREQGDKDTDKETCNAATQTDRVRPLSAGPSLLQNLPSDGGMGPLVSANESSRRSRPQSMVEHSRTPPLKLWRKPGEPPPPQSRYLAPSALPRRARSRSRPTATPTAS